MEDQNKRMPTQPFSMTKLKARTISSIGTVSRNYLKLNLAKTMPMVLTSVVATVGKNDINIFQAEALQRLLRAFDDTAGAYSQS